MESLLSALLQLILRSTDTLLASGGIYLQQQ
jgi:hypothetical protein